MQRSALERHSFSTPGHFPGKSGFCSLFVILLSIVSTQSYSQQDEFSEFDPDAITSKSFNVFHADSFSPLIDLGLEMQEQGKHEEAIDYFKQARQVSRIQHGLFDETQIVLVEAIIESEMELKNWDAVDDHYQHVEYLYNRIYELEDPELEEGLGKVSRWLNFTINSRPTGNRVDQLYRAKRIYSLRLQIAQQTLESDHPKLAFLQENIKICDKQLFPIPDHRRDDSDRLTRHRRRVPLAANF